MQDDVGRSGERTWLVLQRDMSVWFRGVEAAAFTTMVLDLTDRGTRAVEAGSTVEESLKEALSFAAKKPARGMQRAVPDRIQVPDGLGRAVESVLESLQDNAGFRPDTVVEEVTPEDGAERVFDGYIAQLAGRQQPEEPLQPGDAKFLYEQARLFMWAEPWTKLTSDETLLVDLKLGSQRMEGALTVAGDKTAQPGLLLFPGREPARALMANYCPMPIGTIVTMFEGADGPPDLFFRARRYGWPSDAVMTPSFLSVHEDTLRELDRRESYPLALALSGVAAYARGGSVAEAWGNLDLPNGRRGRYHVRKRSEPTDPTRPALSLLSMKVSSDLMPPDSDVQIGILSAEHLNELRRHADVVVPPKIPFPAGINPIPLIVMSPSNRDFATVVDRIKRANPLGATVIERGAEPMLTILGERAGFVIATDRPSAGVWKRNIQHSDGAHVLIVTDALVNKEAPDPDRPGAGAVGRVYGLFECMLRGGSVEALER